MDKRLIDADKLLEWLDVEIDLSLGGNHVLKGDKWAFERVKKAAEKGEFDLDPIPLPTIKPGDTVMYKRNSSYGVGEVKGIDAFVKFENMDFTTRVSLDDLEVSHD